jgi:hypothetical protein
MLIYLLNDLQCDAGFYFEYCIKSNDCHKDHSYENMQGKHQNINTISFDKTTIAKHSLNVSMLANMEQLRNIYATNCNINRVNFSTCPKPKTHHFIALKVLKLSNNQLKRIHHDSFTNTNHLLEILDLSHNKIEGIEKNGLKTLRKLKVLDVSHNLLQDLDHYVFAKLFALTEINLSGNNLKKIDFTIFHCNGRLQRIKLHGNSITEMQSNPNYKTKSLDLSNNQITNIDVLKYFGILEELSLSGNEKLILKGNIFEKLQPGLTKLYLNFLDLSKIPNFSKILLKLPDLIVLGISNNTLKQLLNINSESLSTLETLIVDGNYLNHIEYEAIKMKLPNLKTIEMIVDSLNCKSMPYFDQTFKFQYSFTSDKSLLFTCTQSSNHYFMYSLVYSVLATFVCLFIVLLYLINRCRRPAVEYKILYSDPTTEIEHNPIYSY